MGCYQSMSPVLVESISRSKLDSFYLKNPHRKKDKKIYISDLAIMISDVKRRDQRRVAYKITELNQQ